MLQRLRAEYGLTYLLISHDLPLVSQIADRVSVMYLGELVESGPASAVVAKPLHPYTAALRSATPVARSRETRKKRIVLQGEPPSPLHPPDGCAFHERCPIAQPLCGRDKPALLARGGGRPGRSLPFRRGVAVTMHAVPAAASEGAKIEDLRIAYPITDGRVEVVRGVSLGVGPGETLALVGESGAGKSLTARSLLGLLPHPTFVSAGSISVAGIDVLDASESTLGTLRGGIVGFIPQDPMSALNPARQIGAVFNEVLSRHSGQLSAKRQQHIADILSEVGLRRSVLDFYPHQLSGGMRQRVLIALALLSQPSLIVADEPTPALDATVQAQILDLLARHIAGRVSLILITHDLGVAATVCERIAIMYAGRIVETGPTRSLLQDPQHPYTRGLLEAAPDLSTRGAGLVPIPGHPPRPGQIPPGCAFAPCCNHAGERCRTMPELEAGEHSVACWYPNGRLHTEGETGS